MTQGITWAERVANLRLALGRRPTINELLIASETHEMTPAEIDARRQSWIRSMTGMCEHGEVDFEQCPHCRG